MQAKSTNNLSIDANALLALQATFLSHSRFNEAATALMTDLAVKFELDRVSIGFYEHGQSQIKAISHTADINSKYETNRTIAAAMDEAIEQAQVITHPEHRNTQPYVVLAHAKLIRGTGNQACTIPLVDNGNMFGAITIERNADSAFNTEEIALFENLASLLAPILLLKWKDSHSWLTRLSHAYTNWKQQLMTHDNAKLKVGFYIGLIAILASLFIPIKYNISAPARLEGSIQRALVAPENGYLQQAYVRPGDKVTKGQVLVALADQELLLEKRRWESELAQYENAYNASLAQSDRVQMAINQSKAEVARTELVLIEEKLVRANILAPFDGVIIQGDLLQSLGAPVKRGEVLLSIAPSDSFRLMIEVDERDIAKIKTKQSGKVALISLPGKKLSFHVLRITPVATTKDGRNFFEVEGEITPDTAIPLRPGLDGVAKISAGKRPLIWTLTHRIFNWLSMTLWSWGL